MTTGAGTNGSRRHLRFGVLIAWITVMTLGLASSAPAQADGAATPRAPAPWWNQRFGADLQVRGTWNPIVGNFAGGEDDDIIWYSAGSIAEQLWTSQGDGTFAKRTLPQNVQGIYQPLVGNFGGDEREDIFWFSGGGRPNVLWIAEGSGTRFRSVFYEINGNYGPVVLVNHAARDAIVFVIFFGQGADPVWTFVGSDGAVDKTSLPDSGAPALQLPGDFNGDGYGDFFQYGFERFPDVFSLGRADHGYDTTHPTVNGLYAPIVADLDAGGDGRDDILWYNTGFSGRLVDPIWHGQADGSFVSTFSDLPDTGFPILASTAGHFVEIANTLVGFDNGEILLADQIWHVDGGGEHVRGTGNIRLFKDEFTFVIRGSFTNDTPDLLRYVPGDGREILYSR